jgi:demethylmenaquinone methyltransferase/2-methoxy-6-polyprenyl-1,4-benzoquinol methylase
LNPPSPLSAPSPQQDPTFVRNLFSNIASRYDVVNAILSGGLDYFWRRRACSIVHSWAPERILDLATGSGALAKKMSERCPDAEVIGADFCLPLLRLAKSRRQIKETVLADALNLPFRDGVFDVATVAFGLRNMASYLEALEEMHRVLRDGGRVLILDFSLPSSPSLRWIYRRYLHYVLPHVAGLISQQRSAYKYLGESIEKFPRGEQMFDLLEICGFSSAAAYPLSGGIVTIYIGTKRRPTT